MTMHPIAALHITRRNNVWSWIAIQGSVLFTFTRYHKYNEGQSSNYNRILVSSNMSFTINTFYFLARNLSNRWSTVNRCFCFYYTNNIPEKKNIHIALSYKKNESGKGFENGNKRTLVIRYRRKGRRGTSSTSEKKWENTMIIWMDIGGENFHCVLKEMVSIV